MSLFSSKIFLSSSSVELKIFWSVGNLSRRFFAAAGPIPESKKTKVFLRTFLLFGV